MQVSRKSKTVLHPRFIYVMKNAADFLVLFKNTERMNYKASLIQ